MITRNGCQVKLIDFGLADTDSFTIFKQSAGTEDIFRPSSATSPSPMSATTYTASESSSVR